MITRNIAQQMAQNWQSRQNAPGEPDDFSPPEATCAYDLTEADVNQDARNFFLRDELESEDEGLENTPSESQLQQSSQPLSYREALTAKAFD